MLNNQRVPQTAQVWMIHPPCCAVAARTEPETSEGPGFVPHTSIFWSPHHFLWHFFSLAQTNLSATQTIRNWISLRFQWKTSEICLRCPVWITTFESLYMLKHPIYRVISWIHNDTYIYISLHILILLGCPCCWIHISVNTHQILFPIATPAFSSRTQRLPGLPWLGIVNTPHKNGDLGMVLTLGESHIMAIVTMLKEVWISKQM